MGRPNGNGPDQEQVQSQNQNQTQPNSAGVSCLSTWLGCS
jgi:hypothetical protein